ncbi:haloacid dehalogenase [Collibacillus ludicampi]|uniref:Acid sugar phosphatase n=1 Tax=Collibacillus ludicampi TaxID=2771369 RepID=A0AAV4LAG8_9BACL|nr:TIGR01457 family HAD-type hydrolase [Collibacillus ludicampi]GIM44792.1 haloacid dehalogenase [Collibacillus ludicampi]
MSGQQDHWLQAIEGFLIDLDGTMYRGKEPLPYAKEFVEWLERNHKRYLFVTNNSSKRPEQVAETLISMGIPATPDHVLTSSQATAMFIQEHCDHSPTVHMIGEEGLRTALEEIGCRLVEEEGEYVVVGIDRQFTYEKMKRACDAIQKGAVFIGTNPDKRLPTETGLAPGAGSLARAVSIAAGKDPIWIGKPEARMIEYGMKKIGTVKENTVVIGDNLETDILAGVHAGIRSILVLTGYSKREDICDAEGKPSFVVNDLAELVRCCENA